MGDPFTDGKDIADWQTPPLEVRRHFVIPYPVDEFVWFESVVNEIDVQFLALLPIDVSLFVGNDGA